MGNCDARPSGLHVVRFSCRDFARTAVGSNPRDYLRNSHFLPPLARVLKSRHPQSVPTMPTSIWWNHLSDHPLVQWGITRGVSPETSHPRKGLLKKKKKSLTKFYNRKCLKLGQIVMAYCAIKMCI